MKVIFSQEIPEKEFAFESDAAKFAYLDGKLRIYRQATDTIFNGGKEVDYDILITKPGTPISRNRLYFNGCYGKAGLKKRTHIIPFFLFVRDLVCLRALLEVHNLETHEAEDFESNLLDYAIMLDGKGFIPPPELKIEKPVPEKVLEAYSQLPYQQITAADVFISRIQIAFESTWMPRLRKNTGEYDSNNFIEKSYIKILE